MYALFDIGGTKMRITVSKDGEGFEEPIKLDTPQSSEEGITQIVEGVRKLAQGNVIHAAIGGIAGVLDADHTQVTGAPNIPPSWVAMPLRARLQESLGTPVFIENDTALVGLGEAHNGAGKGFGIVAYITVSTGVGGVRIVHGAIDRNAMGFEIGHQVIDESGTLCKNCPQCSVCGRVDLESMISGLATEKRFGKKAYDIPQSDPLWDELAHWLAVGLHNTILHWSPEVVVLGGSMMVGDPVILVSKVEEKLKKYSRTFTTLPKIIRATLADEGGLHGALAYAKMHPGVIGIR